jgi:hypothetical protein
MNQIFFFNALTFLIKETTDLEEPVGAERFNKNLDLNETIKVVGVNRYNVVSEIAEFKLK